MAKPRTLFSILLEQPWWISALVGVGLFGVAQVVFPPVAPFVALPFFLICAYVGYRQLRTVSPGNAVERLQALRELSWEPFSAIITNAYRRDGYEAMPVNKSAFDFLLTKQGRVTLLQCRRWKANQLGVGPLEELAKAVVSEDAHNAICISAGEFTPKAREFVSNKPITLVHGIELAALVGKVAQRK
ncbi:MAG: restriction endonuclease [Burkholderiales bacterium]